MLLPPVHSFVRLVILAKGEWRRKLRGSLLAARERKKDNRDEIKKKIKRQQVSPRFSNVVFVLYFKISILSSLKSCHIA
jgi:hypothetical protein